MTRVFVVDDSAFIRKALARVLQAEPGLSFVGEAANGADALEKIPAADPDLVTLDVAMPGMGGQEVLRALLRWKPTLKERSLKVLCAGCSSGDEAYSLVIALQNAGLETAGITWEIEAHDVDSEQIAKGREGLYAQGSLRACDPETRRRYFTAMDGSYRLKERHRQGVSFFETNLVAPRRPLGRGVYDVILCRNMLIYFTPSAFTSVIDLFAQSLRPGGYLMLGHSESLLDRDSPFVSVLLDGAVVYRKLPAAA